MGAKFESFSVNVPNRSYVQLSQWILCQLASDHALSGLRLSAPSVPSVPNVPSVSAVPSVPSVPSILVM